MSIIIAHNIGNVPANGNYNTRREIEKLPMDTLITFDGIYRNVWENRDLLLNRRVILFVMGGYMGASNKFDWLAHHKAGVPLVNEMYCDWNQIMELVYQGCELGWHTWTHPDLTKCDPAQMLNEITPPFPMKYFAYPFGIYNDVIIEAVKGAGFEKAFSVEMGDDSDYQIRRKFIRF